MIRLVQKRLIIPRGDTGILSLPAINTAGKDNCAVFTIIDPQTNTLVTEKRIDNVTDTIEIVLTHEDTVNLPIGRFLWDIKFYNNPVFEDGKLVSGEEIDSYYAAYKMPECEIRQTGDKLLTAENAASTTLTPYYINLVESSLSDITQIMRDTISKAEEIQNLKVELTMLEHGAAAILEYDSETNTLHLSLPAVEDGVTPNLTIGTVQEGAIAAATITGTKENPILNLTLPNANVPTKVSQLENDSGYLTTETDPTVPQWAKAITKPSYTPQEVGALPADTYIPQKTSDLTNDSNYVADANYVHTDNNYTTEEKEKLSGIAAGAEVNVNADWNAVSGDAQILNKPTKVSDFTNDAGYLTTETDPTVPAWAKAAQKPTYTASEVGAPTVAEMNTAIETAIGQINSFDMAVVQALPAQDISTHTIYLVPKTGETNDVYDEYIYINNNWEMVGNTQIDLSDYALKSELPTKISDLTDDSGHYTKPATGIPASDLADGVIPNAPVQDVQVNGVSILNDGVANVPVANSNTYGVAKVRVADGVQVDADGYLRTTSASLDQIKGGTEYKRVIVPDAQHASAFYGLAKAAGADEKDSTLPVGQYTDTAKAAIRSMISAENGDDIVKVQDTEPTTAATKIWLPETPPASVEVPTVAEMNTALANKANLSDIPNIPVEDVQVNGVSVLQDGVANVPIASNSVLGAVKSRVGDNGIQILSNGYLGTYVASDSDVKNGVHSYRPISPNMEHSATFYGLAKAAGSDEKNSTLPIGQYTNSAKSAIQTMLGVEQGVSFVESVSGTAVTINGIANTRYMCGEVTTITITPPSIGTIDILFKSGSTVAVLTVPNTVKWPGWFDATALDTDTTYELVITDGVYGGVMAWPD